MQITTNTTPFLAELFASTDKHGQRSCVVVIKSTYDVSSRGECRPAAEQVPFVYVDDHHGDPESTSMRYESDFVPIKPRADILVNANATAPNGRAVSVLEVALEGHNLVKKALVTGDRIWEAGLLDTKRASDPIPFTSMPLVWDRAFGGSDQSHEKISKNGSCMRNLVGVGYHLNGDKKTIIGKPIPNIENPTARMQNWSDKIEPIGFNSVGRGWQPRISFAGTYDERWMEETLPFLPEDFDDRYFQSAPPDQQTQELPAGATFSCLNMSASGLFSVRLPAFRVPIRFLFEDRTELKSVVADTLILEPGEQRMILLGRTNVLLPRKFATLREIHVGRRARIPSSNPHYKNLNEMIDASRGKR